MKHILVFFLLINSLFAKMDIQDIEFFSKYSSDPTTVYLYSEDSVNLDTQHLHKSQYIDEIYSAVKTNQKNFLKSKSINKIKIRTNKLPNLNYIYKFTEVD
jgi:hypothetical protein